MTVYFKSFIIENRNIDLEKLYAQIYPIITKGGGEQLELDIGMETVYYESESTERKSDNILTPLLKERKEYVLTVSFTAEKEPAVDVPALRKIVYSAN